jgi:Natural resistance-associated macrophage protein
VIDADGGPAPSTIPGEGAPALLAGAAERTDFPADRRLGAGPRRHAGRHRCRQHSDGGAGRRQLGLSPAAAGSALDPDALQRAGADGAAWHRHRNLDSVGAISKALSPLLGATAGRAVFAVGVLGASMVAAVVSSLALAWGVGEVAGYRRSLEYRPFEARWFYGVYAVFVFGTALVVWSASDLV